LAVAATIASLCCGSKEDCCLVEKILTTDRIASDPDGRSFLDHVDAEAPNAGIADAVVYYDFPTYADYDAEAHRPDFLLLTQSRGVIAIKFAARHLPAHEAPTHAGNLDRTLSSFSSILIGRILKSRLLRSGRSTLRFEVSPVIVWLGFSGLAPDGLESEFANSFEALFRLIADLDGRPISDQEFAEARSIIEGAKALTRPQRRVIEDPARESKAAALAALESEIANFDERQRQTALSTVQGPQRIRGLAGSGKTVILVHRRIQRIHKSR
jgi:superfamily I DNA and RNA helicase